MSQLAQWRKQNWVRIGTDGSIKGPCGSYCARSAGIKGGKGKMSANYWSRKAWDC